MQHLPLHNVIKHSFWLVAHCAFGLQSYYNFLKYATTQALFSLFSQLFCAKIAFYCIGGNDFVIKKT